MRFLFQADFLSILVKEFYFHVSSISEVHILFCKGVLRICEWYMYDQNKFLPWAFSFDFDFYISFFYCII